MPTEFEWLALAEQRILTVLQTEHAATPAELEARSSERDGTTRLLIDVNHVITARDVLHEQGRVDLMPPAATRGGREVGVYHLPIARGTTRLVTRAAGRKRLLHARWLGWAMGTKQYPRGLIGPAGERVVRRSILDDSLRERYLPLQPDAGEVTSLFGAPIPGGSIDTGAYVVGRVGASPGRAILLMIEVKNLRSWLFPRSPQVYQLLDKCAQLLLADPSLAIVPMLVCRRRHYTTRSMGADLGFFVVELHRQFMLPSTTVAPSAVEDVRRELGFHFLSVSEEPDAILLGVLRNTVPPRLEAFADRWASRVPTLAPYFAALRDETVVGPAREALLAAMRTDAMALPKASGGW
jgi:hypothetical protein